jgi:hypothetical protein
MAAFVVALAVTNETQMLWVSLDDSAPNTHCYPSATAACRAFPVVPI